MAFHMSTVYWYCESDIYGGGLFCFSFFPPKTVSPFSPGEFVNFSSSRQSSLKKQ